MNNITLYQTLVSDLEALLPLFEDYCQFYGRPSDAHAVKVFLLDRFKHGESVLFISQEGDMPVGICQLYPGFSSVSRTRTFVFNDLFFLEQRRRNRIATKLILAASEFATTMGAIRLSLSTAITNESAQALYQSLGWRRDEEFFVYHFSITIQT